VGRTIAFKDHDHAARHFGVWGDITHVPAAAAAAGYDSIQYWEHCEGCLCDFELMYTSFTGSGVCPQGLEFRTGVMASQPCACKAVAIGAGGDHAMCIACSSFAASL